MKFPFSSNLKWTSTYIRLLKKKNILSVSFFLEHPLLIFTLYCAFLLPFCFLLIIFSVQSRQLKEKELVVDQMEGKIVRLVEHQKEKQFFVNKYKNFDPTYVEHILEKVTFLEREVEALKEVQNHPDLKYSNGVKKRLKHLLSEKNRLAFIKHEQKQTPVLEESLLEQRSKIELSIEDLKHLLTLVEDVQVGDYYPPPEKPQLVVQSFHLNSEELFGKENYFLEMNLICRKPKNKG